MTVTAAACSCVNVELCTGNDLCSVNVLPDDEVRALSEYFQGNYQSSLDISRVRIVNIKVDCTISTSERPTSTTTAVVNPIRLRACDQCESKLVSSKTVRPVRATSSKHDTSSSGTLANFSSPSINCAADSTVQTLRISKFSDLLKSLFLSDSHGRCTVTLAVKSDITGNALLNAGDVNENAGQLSTPGSCFSPLSQSVAPVGRMKFGSSDVQTQLRASLFPAGISVGLLHLDAPLFPCDDVSTVIDNQRWGIRLDDDINQNSLLKNLPESTRGDGILERTNKKRKNINLTSETLLLQSPSKSTPSEWIRTSRPSGRRSHIESSQQSLGSRGFSGSRYSESAGTEHTNRTGNSRASRGGSEEGSGSGYMKERDRDRDRDQRRGSIKGYQNSTSANIEKEKNSKRSQETADKLYTILNGRGKDGRSSRLSLGVAASGVPPRSSRRIDMKSMLRQSSAGAFEGLQLETVDPDFVFPGTGLKNNHTSSSSSSTSTGIISAAGDRKMYTSPSIDTTTSTPLSTAAITKKNLDMMKLPETDTDSIATASTVLLSAANTEELLYWKGQSNNESAEPSCPSTPSTVEDNQVGGDHGSELSTFAETYKRSSHLYEVMPQDDGSLFTGLPVTYGKGEFSALAPPEESLAYSACSPSDTRTPDLLSPQGVAFFTRKLSGSKRTTSLFGSMVSSFSSTVSSTFGIFSAVTNPNTNSNTNTNTNTNSESTNSALNSKTAPSATIPIPAQIPVLVPVEIPVVVLGPPVTTLKSQEIKEEVSRDAEMLPEKGTTALASAPVVGTANISLRSLQDLKCDPALLSALTGLSKLKQDIVGVILDCVVNRNIYVLDAAVAVNELLKSTAKKKNTKEVKKKGKKTDTNLVCQILEKITKKPLGGNLAVAQAVSSCCVLLVYILLEIEWASAEKKQDNNVKKERAKIKEDRADEKATREAVNDLIVSSFDRLAVATLSPFLGYDDVNWLTISDTSGGKKCTTDVTTQPVLDPTEDNLLSPRLRKRKAATLTDSPNSATRGLKKKRSLTEKNTPGASPPRSKRDCLWEVVSTLKVRYQRVSAVSSAFRRLTRNFRPVAGVAGEISESDSSPLKSPGVNSPSPLGDDEKSDVRGKESAPPDRFLELLSMKGRTHGLRRASTFSGRTLPMIPLSIAGTALLFSVPSESQIQGPQHTAESDISITSKDLSVGTSKGSGTGHSLKRTNSIVNVHKPSVGQRTGRGKGKNVRTSLKPDPNINSILSFTVPNGSSLGTRKGSPGSKAGRGQVKVNMSKAVEREKPHLGRNDKRNSSSSSSSTQAVSRKVSVPSSDVISSGGSVRRSARKRAREDGDSWRPPTPLTCDVNEVEDTPVHKVRVRQGSASLLASGMRVLRGTSPAVKGVVRRASDLHNRPIVGRDSTHTQESNSSHESTHRKGVIGAGIADSFASAVFGSGSSSRRNSTRRRVSIPFFLPDMGSEKDDYGGEVQTHSAGAALGMEGNSEVGSATKGRRSPRFTSRSNSTVIASSAGNVPIEVELDRELSSSASNGSFSRNAFARSDNAPDSGKKVLQRRHSSAHMPSSPAPSFRLSMISTPPVQHIGKARMGSPVVHRSMADMHTRRTSPRRHYSPV